jgi:hypothetical protein
MMSASNAATKRVSWTMRELQDDELESVSGGSDRTETVNNNETITIGCARTELRGDRGWIELQSCQF